MRDLTLKPIVLDFMGTGSPVGNEPEANVTRRISRNLIYLCKSSPKTAGELSEALGVPMPYVEEELEIQCKGANGSYGTLRCTEDGRYLSNVLLLDRQEYEEGVGILRAYAPVMLEGLREAVRKNGEKLLSLPYLNRQSDLRYLSWIPAWSYFGKITDSVLPKLLEKEGFGDAMRHRPYSTAAIVRDEDTPRFTKFIGCNGIGATNLCAWRQVELEHLYSFGSALLSLPLRFNCDYYISTDPKMRMLFRSVGGLSLELLSEDEKEAVAKGIECGYLRSDGKTVAPQIPVLDSKWRNKFQNAFSEDISAEPFEEAARAFAAFIKTRVPKHLRSEYRMLLILVTNATAADLLEDCVREGILAAPEERIGGEGVVAFTEK